MLRNPEVDSRVKADVLARVASGSNPAVVNFLRLIAEKGRSGELPEIVEELDNLVAAENRVLDVELTTAHELNDEEFGRILGRIEAASGRKVLSLRGHEGRIFALAFSPDGTRLISACEDGSVRIWDVALTEGQ